MGRIVGEVIFLLAHRPHVPIIPYRSSIQQPDASFSPAQHCYMCFPAKHWEVVLRGPSGPRRTGRERKGSTDGFFCPQGLDVSVAVAKFLEDLLVVFAEKRGGRAVQRDVFLELHGAHGQHEGGAVSGLVGYHIVVGDGLLIGGDLIVVGGPLKGDICRLQTLAPVGAVLFGEGLLEDVAELGDILRICLDAIEGIVSSCLSVLYCQLTSVAIIANWFPRKKGIILQEAIGGRKNTCWKRRSKGTEYHHRPQRPPDAPYGPGTGGQGTAHPQKSHRGLYRPQAEKN